MTQITDHERVAAVLHAAGHPEAGENGGYGWRCHRSVDDQPHILVTCEPDDMWRAMPAGATGTAVSQHLTSYASTLTSAGFGVTAWGREDRTEVLIVAASQEEADRQAPGVITYLSALNP